MFGTISTVLALLISACGAAAPTGGTPSAAVSGGAKEPYKFALLLSQTNASAPYGDDQADGFAFRITQINATGGIDGHTAQVQRFDDRSDPATAIQLFRQLAADPSVLAIMGPCCTSSNIALKPVAATLGVPYFGNINAQIMQEAPYSDWFFRTQFNDVQTVKAPVDYFKSLGIKKFSLFRGTDAFGANQEAAMKPMAEAAGLTMVPTVFPTGTTDPSVQVLTAKAGNPEAYVIWDQNPTELALIIKTLRAQGVTQPIVTPDTASLEAFVQAVGPAGDKVRYWSFACADQAKPGLQAEVISAYVAAKGTPPSGPALGAYVAASVLQESITQLLKANKEVTRKNLRDQIESLKDFPTPLGPLSYNDPSTHHGQPYAAPTACMIQGGKRLLAT
jgi:branched-chain amino acid transport system substrate-binding protein